PLGRLPPLAARYFSAREARLRDRADYAGGPPWAVFRTGAACAPNRVVWADLARRLTALALVGQRGLEQIPLNTCYVAAAPSAGAALRIAAWLNSTWIRAAARLRAVPASGGFARFAAGTVAALPLPVAALDDPALDALARAGAEGADVQEDLDDLVARHLALSGPVREDLATVDGVRAGDRR
ncbi:MAG TPA: hypothetical protein VFK09_00725, partial [Gemmatimonadales bacterium]|nr:hypothetical protein [Gemmatimonadales bacterium]